MQGDVHMKKKGNWFLNLILLICLVVAGYAGYQIYLEYREYHVGTAEYDKLEKVVDDKGLDNPKDSSITKKDLENIYQTMKAQNPDYVGWLYVNDTISYPVVQRDNDYYLRRTFNGTYNRAGTLFLDEKVKNGWDDLNVLVYGHNLMNKKMFGTRDKVYCEKHPIFYVYLKNEYRIYRVFSAYKTYPDTDTYQVGFENAKELANYVKAMLAKSYYQVKDADLALESENIVTLSTCTNKNDGRFVVHGYLEKKVCKK